jgi:hypothetical protein
MRSIPTRAAAVCALSAAALALASCTSSSSQAQPGPGSTTGASGTAAASAKPSGGGSYSSSCGVISALKTAGHPCTQVSDSGDTNLKAPGLQSVEACTISSSESAVTVTIFDNHTDALAYATLLTSSQASGLLISGKSERAVVGQNWVVLVPDDAAYAQQVSSALGGTLVSSTSSPAA